MVEYDKATSAIVLSDNFPAEYSRDAEEEVDRITRQFN
jgi:hypothetical protein